MLTLVLPTVKVRLLELELPAALLGVLELSAQDPHAAARVAVLEGPVDDATHGLGDEPPTGVRRAAPVADLEAAVGPAHAVQPRAAHARVAPFPDEDEPEEEEAEEPETDEDEPDEEEEVEEPEADEDEPEEEEEAEEPDDEAGETDDEARGDTREERLEEEIRVLRAEVARLERSLEEQTAARERLAQEVEALADHDPLTGLASERRFADRLSVAIVHAQRLHAARAEAA